MPYFDRATGRQVDSLYGSLYLVDERGRPVYSGVEEWNEEIHRVVRGFRLKAILRGSLPRSEVKRWISSITIDSDEDEIRHQEAQNALDRQGSLLRIGLQGMKGGVVVPVPDDSPSLPFKCTRGLQYCLETAVILHEGYRFDPALDALHVAKGHTGRLKSRGAWEVVPHTLSREALGAASSPENPNLMSRAATVAHFFAKRSSYNLDDILHLLIRWWRRGLYEQAELETAAAQFGMTNVMGPYIQMLRFVPRKTKDEKANF